MKLLLKPVNFTVCLIIMVIMLMSYGSENQFSTATYFIAGILYLGLAVLFSYLVDDGPLKFIKKLINSKITSFVFLLFILMISQITFENITVMPMLHFAIYGVVFGVAVSIDSKAMFEKKD